MKKIFTFAIALVCAIAANAETNVTLSSATNKVEPVVLTAGKSDCVAYVYFTGASTFCGFQANLFLPEGVTITKKANATLTKDEEGENIHTCQYSDKGAEGWQLLVYTSELTKFTADEGAAMKLTLNVPAGFTGGTAQFKNIIFTDPKTTVADGSEIVIAETAGINDINANDVNAPKYNFQGVQVKDAKMFIQNGKKYIVK